MSVLNRLSPGRERTRPGDPTRPADEAPAEPVTRPAPHVPPPGRAPTVDRPAAGRSGDEPTVPVAPVSDTQRHERVEEEEVVTRWSLADAVVMLAGAALAAVGILALVRAGVDSSWWRPEVTVARADHTALLGALETGAGALIVLAGVARSRVLAMLFGVALAVAGAIAVIETSRFERRLAIEEWWAWVLVTGGVVVALTGLVPRRARVRRVVGAG